MKKQYIVPNILMVKADTQEILEVSQSLELSDGYYYGEDALSKKNKLNKSGLWDDSWETPEDEDKN